MQSTIIQFNFIHTFIFTLNLLRKEYTNKEEEKEKRGLMAWIEVYGGQRSLAFELTTTTNQNNSDSLLLFSSLIV